MSTKIQQLEQDILVLQEQNQVLESQNKELATRVEVLEKKASSPPPSRSKTPPPNWKETIQQIHREATVQQVVVSSEALQRFMSGDTKDLGEAGRLIPHQNPEGFNDGFRISGIRSNSLANEFELRNGDILMALNEQPLTSLQEMMNLYQELKTAEKITLLLKRRGQYLVLEYQKES